MEGKGPYRIYDPGGAREATMERLLDENVTLKGKMQGIRSLGELLEESQLEASKLRHRVEELARENTVVGSPPPSSFGLSASQATPHTGHDHSLNSFVLPDDDEKGSKMEGKNYQKSPGSGSSSEFEIVPADEKGSSHGSDKSEIEQGVFGQNADSTLRLHLQHLETTLSECAEEPDHNQLFTHLGRMALEFNRLATKVHKNEQRTSVLQTLCEQLRKENEDLRRKLEKDLEEQHVATENLRVENMELKRKVAFDDKNVMKDVKSAVRDEVTASINDVKLECVQQQNEKLAETVMVKDSVDAMDKKVKSLEHQKNELLEVNKQWDKHFRSMKQQYEQKVNVLRQKLADSQKLVGDLEAEREQKLRDFERKLLLAKSKIETEEGEKEALKVEVQELMQKCKLLQDQLSPVSRQREYQEKEIQRLNKALEDALDVQASAPPPVALKSSAEPSMSMSLRRQDQLTQIQLLKQQVKIYEEDFNRERSDRERMSEEKEALRLQMERLKTQLTQQNTQLQALMEALQREKKEKLMKLLKQHKQVTDERLPPENQGATLGPMFPPYQYPCIPQPMCQGLEEWQIHYPPAAAPAERPPTHDLRHAPPPEYPWWMPCRVSRNPDLPMAHGSRGAPRESDTASNSQPK